MPRLAAQGEWRYVVPPAAPPITALQPLPLAGAPPEDVAVNVELRAATRYGQLRFGDSASIRIAVALARRDDGSFELWLDRDRDRAFDAADRVPGDGPTWQLELEFASAPAAGGARAATATRTVTLCWCEELDCLGVAAIGHLEGEARLGDDRFVAARRFDGDGNGAFDDPEDRLALDLNGDGGFDALTEVYLYRPILLLGETRYAVRRQGVLGVALAELVGAGTLALPEVGSGAAYDVTLISRDGFVVGLRGDDAEVPVGDYRITNLRIRLPDPAGGAPWDFVFSPNGDREPVWHPVAADARVEIDPIGLPEFAVECPASTSAGRSLPVQVRLYTGDGLLINLCSRGRRERGFGGASAAIELRDGNGRSIASASSGFA
ncbi:MAG: hypothetical protein KDE27_23970 [Planctomycetes bacterium]|nr:hypothetical protein [Planctomycetota bacterium]